MSDPNSPAEGDQAANTTALEHPPVDEKYGGLLPIVASPSENSLNIQKLGKRLGGKWISFAIEMVLALVFAIIFVVLSYVFEKKKN